MPILTHKPLLTTTPNQDFLSWFPYRFKWLSRYREKWITERGRLNDEQLWQKWQSNDEVIGVRFGSVTAYAMIDIDRGSVFHPTNSRGMFGAVLECLESIGLVASVIVQSSYSEGVHVYFPLPKPLPTFKTALAIKTQLEDNGFFVKAGQLEVFPNTKAYIKAGQGFNEYNGHRLPLQEGSYLLDDDFQPCSDSLSDWCSWMNWGANRQDIDLFEEAVTNAKNSVKYYNTANYNSNGKESHRATVWRENLEAEIKTGWTGKSQTNRLLQVISTYGKVFLMLSGQALTDWMVKTAQSCSGYQQYCKHQRSILSKCRDWVKCIESTNYYTPYRSIPPRYTTQTSNSPKINKNEVTATEAKERILEALKNLSNQAFSSIRKLFLAVISETQKLFGVKVGIKTFYKHKSLWESLINSYDNKAESVEDIEVNHEEAETIDISEVKSVSHLEYMKCFVSSYPVYNLDIRSEDSQNSQHNQLKSVVLSRFKLFNVWRL